MPGRTRQIKFQDTLPVLTGRRYVDQCPYDCILTSIGFHYPPGCDGLLDVAAGYANEQCYPTQGYLSLNDATPIFQTNEALDVGERLWVEIINNDFREEHTVTVMFVLQERST